MSIIARRHSIRVEHGAERPAAPGRLLPPTYTLIIALLLTAATLYGLLVDDAYRLVPDLTRATWRAQDAVTLATMPVLMWASWRARAGSLKAHLVWVGLLFWLAYCYAHLALGTPYNSVFLIYVALLGLAGFGMLDGLLRVDVWRVGSSFVRAPRRAAAWFLLIAGLGIAALWLSEILAALPNDLPTNVHLSELPNPTWVFDLAWLIPAAIGAAWLLWRDHLAGPVLAGVTLVMLLILSISMLVTTPFALAAGLQDDPDVAPQLVVFTIVFAVLGALELWLLVSGSRRMSDPGRSWMRSSWW